MSNQSEVVEHVGPQARIQAELLKLESQKREFWILVVFAGLVLLLGILSFFFPAAFWRSNSLHISLSPQILFVLMVATVLMALFYVRRDLEIKGLRLSNLQRVINSQQDQAASMIDAVTNVFTRGFLHDLLQGEISRAERTNRPLASYQAGESMLPRRSPSRQTGSVSRPTFMSSRPSTRTSSLA